MLSVAQNTKATSIELEGIFMMANFSRGCLRGSSKTTSDSRNDAHLSITFLLEDRALTSRFFLEDHE